MTLSPDVARNVAMASAGEFITDQGGIAAMASASLARSLVSSGTKRASPRSALAGEKGPAVMAALAALANDACHVARIVEIAFGGDDRLARGEKLAHGDETVALFLQLGQSERECRRRVAAAPIGMGNDDGAGMGAGEDGVGDSFCRCTRIRVSADHLPLDGELSGLGHRRERVGVAAPIGLSLIHISEPTRLRRISYAVFCLKKK